MDINTFLGEMVKAEASDIFVVAGLPLSYKISGRQVRTDTPTLSPADTRAIIESIYTAANRDFAFFEAGANHDDDFSFSLPGVGRFRANVFRQRGSIASVIRVIPFGMPDPIELNIPETVMRLADLKRGLVLVTGPSGAGKSTTLACLIDRINHSRAGHIITMEDPIEYVHRHDKCIVTQREIPTDVGTYSEALTSALRENPDILLLGEMRTLDTIATAVSASEMAQLVFSTLHTTSAASTIDRIIDTYPAAQQHQARLQLSMTLQAIISQQLVPTADGIDTVPVFEIMLCSPAVRNLIRSEKTHQIDSAIAAGSAQGMITMDESLYQLYKAGTITREAALQYSSHHDALERRLAIGE